MTDIPALIERLQALQRVLTNAIDILWRNHPNQVYVQLTETTAQTLREEIGKSVDALTALSARKPSVLPESLELFERECVSLIQSIPLDDPLADTDTRRFAEKSLLLVREYMGYRVRQAALSASVERANGYTVDAIRVLAETEAKLTALSASHEALTQERRYTQAELQESLNVVVDRTIQNVNEGRIKTALWERAEAAEAQVTALTQELDNLRNA
jgi:hypothetical protein